MLLSAGAENSLLVIETLDFYSSMQHVLAIILSAIKPDEGDFVRVQSGYIGVSP